MKSNHDIDKLFSRKLDSLESAPSADAWLKLEKNLQEQRKNKKGIIWFPYAAAAAILLLVVSVWVVNRYEGINREELANVPQQTVPVQQAPTADSANTPVNGQSGQITSPDTQAEEKEPLLAMEQEKNTNAAKRTEKKEPIKRQNKKASLPQIKTDKDAEVKVKPIDVQDKIAFQEPVVTENTLPEPPSVVVVVQVDASENPAMDAYIEEENSTELYKQTRAGKILAKLKKIKKAEFNGLGIDKESIVAFVKDKTGK